MGLHHLELSLLSQQKEALAYLLIEGFGDPLNANDFSAKGYLNVHKFEMSALLAHATKRLIPGFSNVDGHERVRVDGEIWFDVKPGGKTLVKGYINTSSEAENKNMTNMQGFKTNLTGWYSPGED